MIYLDTGCLVKLYYPEPDSATIAAVVQDKPILLTALHELEFANALELKAFFKSASVDQVGAARQLLSTDLQNGVLVTSQENWQDIFTEATRLATQYTLLIGCRSLDVLHCAAAKFWPRQSLLPPTSAKGSWRR